VTEQAVVGDRRTVEEARVLEAALRGAAMAGALEAAVERAREHVTVREQFGRPLAAFQAVTHTMARMAGELAAADVAVEQSLAEIDTGGPGWRTVVARIVTGRAATAVAKGAHQLLGAMGVTREHDLHVATLRLWAWRDEGVSEKALASRLGTAAFVAGEAATWEWCVHEDDSLGTGLSTPWGERR
jgi:alkylation response protein AidB-like acyl-CoA dehydrogenase